MIESPLSYHAIEWPAPEARVAGPVVWLRGWVVGRAGHEFVDLRARTNTGVFLGLLGFPRTDLAVHFAPDRRWLPAEFIVAIAAQDGTCRIEVEAQDQYGQWIGLQSLEVLVAPDGLASPRVEGRFLPEPGGGSVARVPHLPLHGHLDEPADDPLIRDGALAIFGWFAHGSEPLARVSATLDLRCFAVLASGLTDEALAAKVPHLPAARRGRVRGRVPFFDTLPARACLRVFVELADGSVHLALARRVTPRAAPLTESPPAPAIGAGRLPDLPSGRPRRLLVVLGTLRGDDASGRALDVVTSLVASGRWVTRALAAEDGPLGARFESANCAVQQVDLRALTAASGAAAEAELARLDRTIWWGHLDAVAVFDATSAWIAPLARRRGVPIFNDPAQALAWHPPEERLVLDPSGPLLAPIRVVARHGGWTLLGALGELGGDTRVAVTDLREAEEEKLWHASLTDFPHLRAAPPSTHCSAVVCPAWGDHPVRMLLKAAASGVPVISTPVPALAATFAHGELVLVPPGNPLALAHALHELRANPAAARRRSEAAQRIAQQHHHPASLLPRWRAALEAAVATSR